MFCAYSQRDIGGQCRTRGQVRVKMLAMDVPNSRGLSDRRWRRQVKRESEIVLLCNPRAGGRWKELAKILDSPEASHVRRIVTDSVEDIAPAVAGLGQQAGLVCMYGGDGTIQRILDHMFDSNATDSETVLALLGGGTMNVTSRWLGFGPSPGHNFRHVVSGFRSGDLMFKEVPLMEIRAGDNLHHGFTFGMGPIVRILDAYERGNKGKTAAVKIAMQSAVAAFFKLGESRDMLKEMPARVTIDDEVVDYDEFATIFTNVTGQINPGVEPFTGERTRSSFYAAAYACSSREFALRLPFIARGLLPIDVTDLLRKWSRGKVSEPVDTDPRYINRAASRLVIETDEPLYTVDGELLQKPPGPIEITIGPVLKLAVGPKATFTLSQTIKAARSALGG
jgi:diacylglycerol kinase family enzyme